jgi:hypothetical protein
MRIKKAIDKLLEKTKFGEIKWERFDNAGMQVVYCSTIVKGRSLILSGSSLYIGDYLITNMEEISRLFEFVSGPDLDIEIPAELVEWFDKILSE